MNSWRGASDSFFAVYFPSSYYTEFFFLVVMKKRMNIISMGHRLTVLVRLYKVNRPVDVEVAPRSLYPNFQRRSLNFERKGVVAYKRLVGRGHLKKRQRTC